ncbi:rRNA biogenesis protein rrp5 [Jeotgalibaca arthritidis]|nr:rRNA biogenesis protein rrp5 [Jeotgalibaca arthritidis]
MKLLLQVVEDVQALADSLQELAVAMQINESEPQQVETPEPPVKTKPEVKQPTLEEVRGLLARKSQEGKSSEVKALIEKYGASRLSEIPKENYAALVADAEGL